MIIEKLDGPKGDDDGNSGVFQGVVIGKEKDLVDGDWARWTFDDGSVKESRWYAPAAPAQPKPLPPMVTPPQISQDEKSALLAALPVIQKLLTAT